MPNAYSNVVQNYSLVPYRRRGMYPPTATDCRARPVGDNVCAGEPILRWEVWNKPWQTVNSSGWLSAFDDDMHMALSRF